MSLTNDPVVMQRKAAYIDAIRRLHRNKRSAGFVACLLGVLVLAWSRFSPTAPQWAQWIGLSVIAAGWLLFTYVIVSRTRYVRAHPFDPQV